MNGALLPIPPDSRNLSLWFEAARLRNTFMFRFWLLLSPTLHIVEVKKKLKAEINNKNFVMLQAVVINEHLRLKK